MPVSVKNTPLDKETGGNNSFLNTESGAGLQFLLLDRTAKASTKPLFFSTDTGIASNKWIVRARGEPRGASGRHGVAGLAFGGAKSRGKEVISCKGQSS